MLAAVVAAVALLIPGFTPTQAGPAGGQVLQGVYPGTVRPGLLYLPPGFDPSKRYPVAYLLHGMPGSPSEYLAGTGFLATADQEISSGLLRPFIAVMPAAGPSQKYDGEWAGPWEQAIVNGVVPWVDAHLPTLANARDRLLAGLSAGGFGAADIALRHPGVFGRVESWSGYFQPLHDGPFKHASQAVLAANDPTLLVPAEASRLRVNGTRFFVSTGPYHSHWFRPQQTVDFAKELHDAGIPVAFHRYAEERGVWRAQVAAGLLWAYGPTPSP